MAYRQSLSFIFLCGLALLSFRAAAGSDINAVAYNQTIMLEQDRVAYRLTEFMQHVSGKNLILLQLQILNSIETIDVIGPYSSSDSSFHQSARALFGSYKDVSKFQYPKILELVENPDIEDTQFNQQLDAIRQEIAAILAPHNLKFTEEQEKFAQKYGFQFKPQE